VTAKDLQQDLVATGTEVSACTVGKACTKRMRFPCQNSKTYTTTDPKAQEKSAPICSKSYK